ncbi:MAG TPA: hypothetical protein VGN83_18825 [Falsiroseomonas sp.]|jgi:hypothetical protein|nr:hypothetical protein [Falsiroseomonas sp.]
MDPLEIVTDRCIRRGLGFAGLGVGMVMLALSFDLPLALRSGASLVALAAVAMLLGAWHAPRRDMRHSEVWLTLNDMVPELVRRQPKQMVQQHLQHMMRRRLVWHAERVGLLSIGLWVLALLVIGLRALFG